GAVRLGGVGVERRLVADAAYVPLALVHHDEAFQHVVNGVVAESQRHLVALHLAFPPEEADAVFVKRHLAYRQLAHNASLCCDGVMLALSAMRWMGARWQRRPHYPTNVCTMVR